jgi:predicted dienelactone hydrolase
MPGFVRGAIQLTAPFGAARRGAAVFAVVLCGALGARCADPPRHAAGLQKLTLSYTTDSGEARERAGLVWYPTATEAKRYDYKPQIGSVAPDAAVADGAHPLIVFSHGFLGAADQTIFLMEEFARHGYIVAGVDHADSLRGRRGGRSERLGFPNFADAKSWDEAKFRDRKEDVSALLAHLLALNAKPGDRLFAHVNADAIGAAGHSLGGYTVLGMIGGWPGWRDERIRAALLLSPYATPVIDHGDLAAVRTPVMLQGGTLDWGITPFLRPLYNKLDSPRYLLVLKNETHFGWTNLISLGKTTQECIEGGNARWMTDYSLAFFDRHLRREKAVLLERPNEELQSYVHDGD